MVNSCLMFSSISPDLHARICKTYYEAISQKKSLTVAYGGVVGIKALGAAVVRSLLLPNLSSLTELVDISKASLSGNGCMTDDKLLEVRLGIDMVRDAVRQTLGMVFDFLIPLFLVVSASDSL